jgi:hypothetical protein
MLSFDSGHIGFDLDSVAALGLIVPHFSLAIALGTLRDALCLPAKWPWPEAFHGAALIRDGARLLGAYQCRPGALEANDGIGLLGGRLVAMNPAQTPRLRDHVAAAAIGIGSDPIGIVSGSCRGLRGPRLDLRSPRNRLAGAPAC